MFTREVLIVILSPRDVVYNVPSLHQWRTVGSLVHGYSPPTSAVLESHDDVADVVQQVAAIGQYLFSFSITFFWIMNCLTVMSQSRAAGKRMT